MDDTYDDGLVHSHNWACGPQDLAGIAKSQGAEIVAALSSTPQEEHLFDDGLVHSHDWARN